MFKRLTSFFRVIFIIICIGLIIFGLSKIINNKTEIADAQTILDDIKTTAAIKVDVEDKKSTIRERDPFGTDLGGDYYWGLDDDIDIDIEVKEATTINEKRTGNYYLEIDFDEIKAEYPNVVAYLKVNGTNVEYPIVQGEDNKFYLKHSIDDSESGIGWPFMDYRSDSDVMVGNTVIYGHNIKNKTMFGELTKLINNKKWFDSEANSEIYFVTEDKTYVYKIFSVYNSSPKFNYFKTDFENIDEFNDFLSVVKSKNKVKNIDSDINTTQVLTLSTCYNSGTQRLVIHAYLERSANR